MGKEQMLPLNLERLAAKFELDSAGGLGASTTQIRDTLATIKKAARLTWLA